MIYACFNCVCAANPKDLQKSRYEKANPRTGIPFLLHLLVKSEGSRLYKSFGLCYTFRCSDAAGSPNFRRSTREWLERHSQKRMKEENVFNIFLQYKYKTRAADRRSPRSPNTCPPNEIQKVLSSFILKCPLNKPHCGLFRQQELHNFIESVLFHRFYEMQTLQQCNKAYFRRSEAAFL